MEIIEYDMVLEQLKSHEISGISDLCVWLGERPPEWDFVLEFKSDGWPTCYKGAPGYWSDGSKPIYKDWEEGMVLKSSSEKETILGLYRHLIIGEARGPVGEFSGTNIGEVVTSEEYQKNGNRVVSPKLLLEEWKTFGWAQCLSCGAGTEESPEPKFSDKHYAPVCSRCDTISWDGNDEDPVSIASGPRA